MLDITFITNIIGLPWIIFNTIVFIIIYKGVLKNWSFFTEKKINFLRGPPILGVQWRAFLARDSFLGVFKTIYAAFPNEKFIGMYDLLGTPKYFLRDPELIKQVTIKDFDHFSQRSFVINKDNNPLFGRLLSVLHGQQWKDMRSTLSPAFTGHRMRLMFSLIGDVSRNLSDHIKNEVDNNGSMECEIGELLQRYSNDTIGSCAFGLNINSLKDRDNEFYKIGTNIFNFGFFGVIRVFISLASPLLGRLFKIRIFREKDEQFFRRIVMDTMKYREENNIIRNDMINLLMEVRRGELIKETDGDVNEQDDNNGDFATSHQSLPGKLSSHVRKWDDDDLVAQCMLFFVAGFGPVAGAICYLAHSLAVYPNVQDKLVEEIQLVNQKLNGIPITYEDLQKMKYLDQVVSEVLRIAPIGAINDRVVTKPYTLEATDGTKVSLNIGDVVVIPTIAIHSDSNYFPNPETFDPERFNDENKMNIQSGSYLPFGLGPRSCIASRFALMECKACIYELVSKFHLEMCDKTQHPIKYKAGSPIFEPAHGFWLRLKVRSE